MRVKPKSRGITKFNFVNILLFFLVVSIIASAFYLYVLVTNQNNTATPNEEIAIRKEESPDLKWWDMKWKNAVEVEITNPTYSEVPEKEVAKFTLNHKLLVDEGKSRSDGLDLTLVFHGEDNVLTPLNFNLSDSNTDKTAITFSTKQSLIKRFTTSRYFLYYGNLTQAANPYLSSQRITESTKLIAEIGENINPAFSFNVGRKWFLKGNDLPANYKNLEASVQVNPDYEYDGRAVTGEVIGTNLKAAPVIIQENSAIISLDVSSLNPGNYKFKTIIDTYEDTYDFKVSYPLYTTWTMDWEGYDVKDEYLKYLDDLADGNGMPITHYFNPRIFVYSSITPARKQYLTKWVIDRRQRRGDEIGMHLHMFYDFIEAAGVTRRTEASWEPNSKEGYEVLTAAYTPEEFNQIVTFALKKFEENKLPKPVGYRAGGWFINLDNLKQLPSLGFKYDSSGRESYIFGRNKVPGFWTLKATTKPYKISASSQNNGNPPTINLWEFPNNGADSTNRDVKDMIQRFNDNFKSDFLKEKQVVTFLSHPHWFATDKPRMEALFAEMNKYKAADGNGPVVYTTLEKTYEVWTTK